MPTKWREGNRARWVGIRPGHNGEQVQGSGSKSNGYDTLYTVGAGKVLFVFNWWMTTYATGAGSGYIMVRDTVPAVVAVFCRHAYTAAGSLSTCSGRFVPWEVPEGYTVEVYSSAAVVSAYGGFDGILIDA